MTTIYCEACGTSSDQEPVREDSGLCIPCEDEWRADND